MGIGEKLEFLKKNIAKLDDIWVIRRYAGEDGNFHDKSYSIAVCDLYTVLTNDHYELRIEE